MSVYRLDWYTTSVLGQALPGIQVYVCTQPASTGAVPPGPLASLFTDSTGSTPKANPMVTDGYGHCFGYMASGLYTVVEVQNGSIVNIYPDQAIGVLTFGIVTANTGPLPVNSVVLGNGGSDLIAGPILSGNASDYFSGQGIFLPLVRAQSQVAQATEWLKSYDASTGLFTVTGITYGDISGPPQLAQTTTAVTHQFLTAYDAPSGTFSSAQPSFSDISGTAVSTQYVTMVGDSGAGGVKGAAPAPGAGDAAAAKFLKADGTWQVPSGSGVGLTSVGLSTNATWLTVGASPLTSNGTITLNKTTGLTANKFLGTPNGSTGVVDLRSLVAADIPSLPGSIINSSAVGLAYGGTAVDLSAQGGSVATTGKYVVKQDASHVITSAALIATDIPGLPATQITSGQLALARGGTNADLSATGSTTAFLAQDASHVVSARSIVAADLPARTVELVFIIDGGGAAPIGAYYSLNIPVAMTITKVVTTSDVAGSCVLTLKAAANGTSFQSSLTSIVASAPPTLSSAYYSTDSTLSGWTTSLSSNSQLQVGVTSANTLTRIVLSIICTVAYA